MDDYPIHTIKGIITNYMEFISHQLGHSLFSISRDRNIRLRGF